MPHGWVASDFIRATLDLFAYEREAGSAMVLAAGIPESWLGGDGIAVKSLRTPYGPISYTLRDDGAHLALRIEGGSAMPPGGFVFAWPGDGPPGSASINGKPAEWAGADLRINTLPATVMIDRQGQRKTMD
jgi:hypothetical protein